MKDFSFCIPTCFIQGRNAPDKAGKEIASRGGRRVLVVNDGQRLLQPLVQRILHSIEGAGLVALEMPDKATRPLLSIVHKGVDFCKHNDVDFILAVGGGTVMDTAKAIAFFCCNDGAFTDYVLYRKFSAKCLPVACVVTMSGTGSEISATAMIVDDAMQPEIKYPLFQDSMRFRFAITDPALSLTLPMRNTMAGAFDSITHIMEHYFNGDSGYDLQDRMCEAVMKSIMINMLAIKNSPDDCNVRAQLQMAATLANSTLLGLGCDSDWAIHYMENPITTQTHILHGEGLAIIAPAWMRYCYKRDLNKAFKFAVRVMDVSPIPEDKERTALAGIEAFEAFIDEAGLPRKLSQIGIDSSSFREFARRAKETGGAEKVGGISRLDENEVMDVYAIAI